MSKNHLVFQQQYIQFIQMPLFKFFLCYLQLTYCLHACKNYELVTILLQFQPCTVPWISTTSNSDTTVTLPYVCKLLVHLLF